MQASARGTCRPAVTVGVVAYGVRMDGAGGQRRRGLPAVAGWLADPRRRLAAALGLAVVVLVATGLTIAAVGAGARPGARPSGSATVSAAPRPSPVPAAQRRPGPVLLIPGYGGGTGALDSLAARIRSAGRSATVLALPGRGTGSLAADAAGLNRAVRAALAHGAPSVDIVGYSAGGVVALIWARHYDGEASARRIITLGAPFHGTELAALARTLVPGDCPAACRQLVPGSALLRSLSAGSPAGLPPWLSLWTTDDAVVTPPDSASLAGAVDVAVQSVCPAVVISHEQLPVSAVVQRMVLTALGTGPLRAPTAAACG